MAERCAFGRKDDIGAQRQLETTAGAQAVHHRDDRQGQAFEAIKDVHVTLEARTQLAGGVVGPRHDVAAKAEVLAFGAHQQDARVTAFDRVDRRGQLVNHLVADAILR